MGFEWDFEGGHFMRRAIDFVGIWRGAFYEVWVPVGFGGGGHFMRRAMDLGGILLTYQNLLCFNHSTPQNLRIALAER